MWPGQATSLHDDLFLLLQNATIAALDLGIGSFLLLELFYPSLGPSAPTRNPGKHLFYTSNRIMSCELHVACITRIGLPFAELP